MKSIDRRITDFIKKDMKKKMVLLAGPRQCGKSTLVKGMTRAAGGVYLNWDVAKDRAAIQNFNIDLNSPMWTFDELHKFRRWRNFLKGLYDEYSPKHKILVTGSARLEVYGRGGDSLQGRYLAHHLHPFTFSELSGLSVVPLLEIPHLPHRAPNNKNLHDLLKLGGFPEPFLSGSELEAKRWRMGYASRLVQEEVRSLENIKELERVELLYDRLSDVSGSVLSINSLREDLDVAFETVKKWIAVLENLYAIFRISPYGPPKLKSIKKDQKLYFWDWPRSTSEGAKFENMMAMHLLRFIHWARDVWGENLELRYFRTRVGHEVDFVILKDRQPWMAIETKISERELSSSLKYFLERVKVPYAFQVCLNEANERRLPDINGSIVQKISAKKFLANLP